MHRHLLFQSTSLMPDYDLVDNVMGARWTAAQTRATTRASYEQVLAELPAQACHPIRREPPCREPPSPEYGHFGYATGHGEGPTAPPTAHDEMAKLRPNRVPQRGHVTQNQDVAAVQAAHNATEAVMRASYARDDPRYAGGDVYDLSNEQTSR